MKEIALLIERDGTLYPIEIKKHSDTTTKDISDIKIGSSGVFGTYEKLTPLYESDKIILVSYI